jgi:hypothetical protein
MLLKLLHITLAIHILFASLGIKIEKHFCGEKLQTVKLFEEKKACCAKNNAAHLPDCCHNDESILSINEALDIQKVSFSFEKQLSPFVFVPLTPYFEAFLNLLFEFEKREISLFIPIIPPLRFFPLYLKHHALLV